MADLPLSYGIQVFNGDFVGRAYKPVKKVVERTVESVPLPTPRPVFDKLLEYTPFVPSQGLDLPTVGTAWLLSPWTALKMKIEEIPLSYWEAVGLLLASVALLTLVTSSVLGIIILGKKVIRKLWK